VRPCLLNPQEPTSLVRHVTPTSIHRGLCESCVTSLDIFLNSVVVLAFFSSSFFFILLNVNICKII